MADEQDPRELAAEFVARRAALGGMDPGRAVQLGEVLAEHLVEWVQEAAEAARREAYHEGRADQRAGKPCPYCECQPRPRPRPIARLNGNGTRH